MKKSAPSEKPTTATSSLPRKAYWELKVPRLNLQNTPTNAYLVIALVIFSFFLGMLTNKVMYLEEAAKNGQANTAAAAETTGAIPTIAEAPQFVDVEPGKLPVLGDKNAKVTIVEFSDLQCPFCKSFVDETFPELKEKYIDTGKVKLTFRHYPLNSIHPNAQKAGEASECANEQGKFWEYHDKLFATQESWSPYAETELISAFVTYAGDLGLDTAQFQTCLDTDKYKQAVIDDTNAGNKAQVDGTPAFFINGQRVTGAQPFSSFETIIEEQLKK